MSRPLPKNLWLQAVNGMSELQIKTGILDPHELLYRFIEEEFEGMRLDVEVFKVYSSLARKAIKQHHFRESKGMSHKDPNK